jgi:tetratricopeptide (TPR) repeat protein
MTDLLQPTSNEHDSLAARLLDLVQEVELSNQWRRPCILLAAYGSEYVRTDSITVLENHFMDLGLQTHTLHADNQEFRSNAGWSAAFEQTETVYFVDRFGKAPSEPGRLRSMMNHIRDIIHERGVSVIFWLTYKEIAALARVAPDFWLVRNRMFDFVASPKPEQILQTALESAWQGTGEYDDEFTDTEAKISLRESILTELPHNAETASVRANLLLNLGILNWRRGEYDKADEILRQALNLAAQLQDNWFEAQCFNAVALIHASLGRNDDAIDAYKQAIHLAPRQIFAWNNLGILCLKINRNDEAMIAFQKAIEHNPDDPVAWNGLGDVYSRTEYLDDAIAAYRKSIERSPVLPHPWNGLGEVYAGMGRANEAIAAFQKAIELNPRYLAPWLRLAELFAKLSRYREAVKSYQQALLLDTKNSAIWNDLGVVYLNAGKIANAVESLSKAIELDRGFGWAYSNLGLAYTTEGNVRESIEPYLKSLELLHDDELISVTWNRLANSHRLLKEYDKAIQAYQHADSLLAEPFADLYPASDSTQPDSPAEADAAPEAKSTRPVERSEEQSVESIAAESESIRRVAGPSWIFEPATNEMSAPNGFQFEPGARQVSQHRDALLLADPPPTMLEENPTYEIGGLTMQLSVPKFSSYVQEAGGLFAADKANSAMQTQPEPARASVWNEMGNVHFLSGSFEKAIHAYNKAISLDSSFGWAFSNLGITYLALGRYAEAISLLQKSIELLDTGEERAVAWNGLGNLYRSLNDYDNAVVAYQKADELDPNHAGVRDEAGHFNVTSNNEDAEAWIELGDLMVRSHSYREATVCYQKAADLEPFNGAAYSNLAMSLSYQAKFKESVPHYIKSIELLRDDKDKAVSWNRLGNVYRRLNDYDNAIAAYQNAVKLTHEPMTLVSRARFSLLGNCFVD